MTPTVIGETDSYRHANANGWDNLWWPSE